MRVKVPQVKAPRLKVPQGGSLVGRLIWLAAAWGVSVMVVTLAALTFFFYASSLSRFDEGLKDIADGLYAGSGLDDSGSVVAPPLTDARALRVYSGKYWQLAEAVGARLHSLARSRSLWDAELPGPANLAELTVGSTLYYDAKGPQSEPLRLVALTRVLPGRKAPVIFMAAEDRSPIDRDVESFAIRTAALLVLAGGLLVAAVVLQVRVGLKPLFDLRKEVMDVRKGRAEHVAGRYPAELEPLAQELNALVAHNQEVVERQRTHVGNLAHALKTPLSVMLAEAGRAEGGGEANLAELVARQAQTMRLQVDHHLRRARTAARAQGSRDRTPVTPALEELARTLERIFEMRAVIIDWTASPDDLAFQGERQDLLEIAGNVMENACKWCRRQVWVSAEAMSDERLRLVVEDDGPGLPPEVRAEALKRGARLDEGAPGSGLGLSIVDELVRAYGGRMTLEESAHGGLLVSLELPRA
jgi:signal transduction histidine kinase